MSYNKVAAAAAISTNLFLVLGMTPNCANAISNMEKGCQEILFSQFSNVRKGSSNL